MRTLQEKYNGILEEKFSRKQFINDAMRQLPGVISKFNGFDDTVKILKNRGIITEPAILKEDQVEESFNPPKINPDADHFSAEEIQRGTDYELEKSGVSSIAGVDERVYEKARNKVIKNLKKDKNYYLRKLTGEKKDIKRTDLTQPVDQKKLFKTSDAKGSKAEGNTDDANQMKKVKLKEGFKRLISKILTEQNTVLSEAKTEHLEEFVNYENEDNEELAKRIRVGAKELQDIVEEIDRTILKHRDKIEAVYANIGSFMAPAVANAFNLDLKPVLLKYHRIDIPKSRELTPDEVEALKAAGIRGKTFAVTENTKRKYTKKK